MMKTIVVSAVNLNRGGTLAILRECLQCLSVLSASGGYRIIALVYDKQLVCYPHIHYLEMRWSKKTWVNRLWCEYVTMKTISRKLHPVYLWLSLHDTTPSVIADRRAVYCHNSFLFYRWKLRDLLFAPKIVFFALFSKYAYKINLHRNSYVIVQQQWFKDQFIRMFRLNPQRIVVASPLHEAENAEPLSSVYDNRSDHPSYDIAVNRESVPYRFFFPAIADSHKNFECICEAVRFLEKDLGTGRFNAYITVKGTENAYARWLRRKWGDKVVALKFIGYQDKASLSNYYHLTDCLIFPSKVETWGLPITEFAALDKPMLLADLPYAHETAGGCNRIAFFNPDKPQELTVLMKRLILADTACLKPVERTIISSPMACSWEELFKILLR